MRSRRPAAPPASANRDVNLDIGETVHVDAWNADGTATVQYRGANGPSCTATGSTPSSRRAPRRPK